MVSIDNLKQNECNGRIVKVHIMYTCTHFHNAFYDDGSITQAHIKKKLLYRLLQKLTLQVQRSWCASKNRPKN